MYFFKPEKQNNAILKHLWICNQIKKLFSHFSEISQNLIGAFLSTPEPVLDIFKKKSNVRNFNNLETQFIFLIIFFYKFAEIWKHCWSISKHYLITILIYIIPKLQTFFELSLNCFKKKIFMKHSETWQHCLKLKIRKFWNSFVNLSFQN